MTWLRILVAFVTLAALAALTVPPSHRDDVVAIRTTHPPHARPAATGGKPTNDPAPTGANPEATAELVAFVIDQQVRDYLDALEQERIEREHEAEVAAAAAAEAAAQAARMAQTRPAPTAPAPSRGTISGDCAPVAAVVGWGTVQNESGGQPGATNGQYLGCAQIGAAWWNGPCAGLDWQNVNDQATCARIVMERQGPSAWRGTYAP